MVLADTLAIFLVVVGVMVSLPGLWLLCRGLWPHAVATSTASLSGGLVKAFLTGIPLAIVATILAAVLSKVPSLGGALVVLVISVFVIYASVGIAGLATSVGQKLPSPGDNDCPWRVTMRGSTILVLSFLLPFIGWFVILPAVLLIGSGSTTLNFFRAKDKNKPLVSPGDQPPQALTQA